MKKLLASGLILALLGSTVGIGAAAKKPERTPEGLVMVEAPRPSAPILRSGQSSNGPFCKISLTSEATRKQAYIFSIRIDSYLPRSKYDEQLGREWDTLEIWTAPSVMLANIFTGFLEISEHGRYRFIITYLDYQPEDREAWDQAWQKHIVYDENDDIVGYESDAKKAVIEISGSDFINMQEQGIEMNGFRITCLEKEFPVISGYRRHNYK